MDLADKRVEKNNKWLQFKKEARDYVEGKNRLLQRQGWYRFHSGRSEGCYALLKFSCWGLIILFNNFHLGVETPEQYVKTPTFSN